MPYDHQCFYQQEDANSISSDNNYDTLTNASSASIPQTQWLPSYQTPHPSNPPPPNPVELFSPFPQAPFYPPTPQTAYGWGWFDPYQPAYVGEGAQFAGGPVQAPFAGLHRSPTSSWPEAEFPPLSPPEVEHLSTSRGVVENGHGLEEFFSSPQPVPSQQTTAVDPTVLETPAATLPSSRDAVLIEGRNKGLTYRQIKERYHLTEPESTLRGRYRNLTKPKEFRRRKPVWEDRDVELLRRAVDTLAIMVPGKPMKISWTRVAEFMRSHGASYPFANGTCKRKWLTLRD